MHSLLNSSALEKNLRDFEAEPHGEQDVHKAQVKTTQDVTSCKDRIRHAKADCLRLTHMMCEKLPRELRELVYQYICIEEQHIPVGPYYHYRLYKPSTPATWNAQLSNGNDSQLGPPANMDTDTESEDEEADIQIETILLPDGRVKEDHSNKPASDILMPHSHVFNSKYVGGNVAYETQEVYYTYNTFSVCNVDDGIQRFLDKDTAQMFNRRRRSTRYTGVKPVHFVRKLQIRLKCEHFLHGMAGLANVEELQQSEQRFLEDLQASVERLPALLKNRQMQELSIEFVLMTDLIHSLHIRTSPRPENHEMRCLVNILQAVRNVIFRLMHDCGNIVVTIIHHDEKLSAFPRNITGLYPLTKEQWEYEKKKNAGRSDWTCDFYVLPAGSAVDKLSSGFSHLEMDALLQERWGISSALNTNIQKPVREGKYWPVRKKD